MSPDRRAWLLPLIALLYAVPFPYFPRIHSPNEGSRLYQARALVDDRTFAVNGEVARYGPIGDLARSGDLYYPNKAPGVSILGAGVYAMALAALGGQPQRLSNETVLYLLRFFCCSLPTLVLLVFFRRQAWAWAGDGVAADQATLSYALGSLAYTYGLLYFSHQLAAVCLAGAFLAIEAVRRKSRPSNWGLLLAGGLAGCAVLTEYTAALAALPLGLYVLATVRPRWRGVAAFGLSSLPPQAVLLWYHRLAYGSPFRIGYQNNVSQQFQGWHHQGFMGVTTPTATALFGSFFSPAKGMWVFSPFLALGLWGLWRLGQRPATRTPAILLASLFVLYAAFTASFIYEAWGWTVGPRHLAPLAAFLALPAATALASARKRSPALAGGAAGLCLLSVVLTGLATVTYPHFPDVFTNGFFEVTVPLLRAGYLPRNLLGLAFDSPSAAAVGWWLFFATWGAMLGWLGWNAGPPAGGRLPWVARATALATVVLALALLSTLDRAPNPEKDSTARFIFDSYRGE